MFIFLREEAKIVYLTCHSTNDDAALRAKVEEALTVYDEYVKSKSDTDGAASKENGPAKESETQTTKA